ncbi:MAG: DNA mismatch repair protein MutS [Clostridia bacterium]|nr:DNA mismatch repair protein MutS [Clostridia bacterium]
MSGTLSPMMRQYMEIKERYSDCLLFYRLGDFYELFFDDAQLASAILGLTLTGRDCGLDKRAPMCGVPYHSVDGYISKLIQNGHKVAICEQVEDPSLAKGIVERSVTRVITPGTVIEEEMLDQSKNNYIMSLCFKDKTLGFAYADVSTGEFCVCELSGDRALEQFYDEFVRVAPTELILIEDCFNNPFLRNRVSAACYVEKVAEAYFAIASSEERLKKHFKVASLDGFGIKDSKLAVAAGGALLRYLEETQKNALSHISLIKALNRSEYMQLDPATRRSLELTRPSNDSGTTKNTLFALLNRCSTAMGSRRLRAWIETPLQSCDSINYRLEAVQNLFDNLQLRGRLYENLKRMYDIERLSSRIAYQTINPRDCLALARTLRHIVPVQMLLMDETSEALANICRLLDPLTDLAELLERAVSPDAPAQQKSGGYIRSGYDERIDELRAISSQSETWLRDMENRERESTGIKTLRIGFNRVFGYYIEVTRSFTAQVPYYFERRQTLANAERYITPELKELGEKLLTANDRLIELENQIFSDIKQRLLSFTERLQLNAALIAELDCYLAFAETAVSRRYTCPKITDDGKITIVEGRHPIVETAMNGSFIPNDVDLDLNDNRLLIITGPNMAGKSTYMRQIALITLMAHLGSFVPASKAQICIVDRIFTRIGASDDLSGGQSTFMVEMSEMANIINNATNRSLLILDEIGRGTSTFDGLSIAWSVLEHIANPILCGAKTLFATHYHELSELEGKLDGVKNYRISVKEIGDDILFLRKIIRGSGDKSFGIQVAKMAGLPSAIIERSKEILVELEQADILYKHNSSVSEAEPVHPESKAERAVISDLRLLNPNTISPMEALKKLFDYSDALKN